MRIMEIVTGELALDKMKAEENLQTAINSKEDINIKSIKIKQELERIVNIDNMINTWVKYMSTDESNNNNK